MTRRRPEILAPAGDLDSMKAALASGADAVYFGLTHFSARAKVGFTLEELPEVMQTLLKLKDGSGRVAAHEIMVGTPAIRNLIRENKIAQMYSMIQTGSQFGMQTLDHCMTELVRRNVITVAEARQYAKTPESFAG